LWTARLLYLAKGARLDILTVTIFLCEAVEDQRKLMRVLGYLKGMQEAMLLLSATGVQTVVAYVDAAYAIHND
jgi:hypothetical protein